MIYHPARVTIDDETSFACSVELGDWNGWARPVFTKEQAEVVASAYGGTYHQDLDGFSFPNPNDPENPEFYGAIHHTDGVTYYGIGNGEWIWDLVD